MNIDEYKERLIVEGLESVRKHETRPSRLRGGVAGFELCRTLNSMWDFQDALEKRHKEELNLAGRKRTTADIYWEYRYATVQVEYVYERMLVMWSQLGLYQGPLSARAVLRAAAHPVRRPVPLLTIL